MTKEVDYYAAGNSDLATETPLTVQRLEARRKLTKTATRTVIALVGLPARGKSFVSRKLQHYLNWTGVECKIFNVGKYRREAYANELSGVEPAASNDSSEQQQQGQCSADFFDATNERAAELREKVAEYAMLDMLKWLDDCEEEPNSDGEHDETLLLDGQRSITDLSKHSSVSLPGLAKLDFKPRERVAIFDATNSTDKRRKWILEMCTKNRQDKQTGVVFVESICDDKELLEENYRYKVSASPDYVGCSLEGALDDLRNRVQKYEDQYETITDESQSYIKIFNLSTKLMVNHIYGRMAKEVVPALMAWHIGTRPVYLCRPGQTISGILTDGEDYVNRKKINVADPRFKDMSSKNKRRSLRGDKLGPNGVRFRDELFDFCAQEAHYFAQQRASVRDMAFTGTSISGLCPGPGDQVLPGNDSLFVEPFPLRIYTSTMPRAHDTVNWEDFHVNQRSNLNPLDKGDFNGFDVEEVKELNPEWYKKLERDPYNTRFPGGESYRDLMSRLTSIVIDVEQQVVPTLVVSHVSILQCLMAYFRNTRVEKCMSIEVPLHTVVKFTPVRGGGWSESHHPFYDIPEGPMHPVESSGEISQMTQDATNNSDKDLNSSDSALNAPIWGDGHVALRRHNSAK